MKQRLKRQNSSIALDDARATDAVRNLCGHQIRPNPMLSYWRPELNDLPALWCDEGCGWVGMSVEEFEKIRNHYVPSDMC